MARIIIALLVTVPTLYAGEAPRAELDLCGTWQAAVDPNNIGEGKQWYDLSVELPEAAEVNVPASFANIAAEYKTYKGPGWFRRSFNMPTEWKGKRVMIHFEAVNNQSKVWINGQLAGENPDAFLPFELDISDFLNYGQENTIAVKADTTHLTNTIPGNRIGWHQFGGIIREVRLSVTNRRYLDRIQVKCDRMNNADNILVSGTVNNNGSETVAVDVGVQILKPDGTHFTSNSSEHVFGVEGGQLHAFSLQTGVSEEMERWTPENPALYTAKVSLRIAEQIVDEKVVRFGFRTIEAKDAKLYLNGKPILLTGFDRHEDSPRMDMCPDHELVREDLLKMKNEFGANFVRLSHYPQHPAILDMCDEIGMLVMCELPLYMWRGIKESGDEYHQVYEDARRQLETLINRDYNHPSVIMWSISNETWPQYLEVVGANTKLVAWARRLDPTRLALHVSDHWRNDLPDGRSRQDHFGEDDIIGINGYPHRIFRKDGRIMSFWHEDVRGAKFDTELIAKFWSDGLDMLHAEYPNKPILVTEYGWRSDEGHRQQAQFIAAGARGMKKPWLAGATIWCWADHAWSSRDKMRFSPYGIYTRQRKPKPSAVAATKQAFSELREYFENLHADAAK